MTAAYQEIGLRDRTRISVAADDTHEVIGRARSALAPIANAMEERPGTGQARRLVRFIPGVYNGGDYPFDLTDLRALDTDRHRMYRLLELRPIGEGQGADASARRG